MSSTNSSNLHQFDEKSNINSNIVLCNIYKNNLEKPTDTQLFHSYLDKINQMVPEFAGTNINGNNIWTLNKLIFSSKLIWQQVNGGVEAAEERLFVKLLMTKLTHDAFNLVQSINVQTVEQFCTILVDKYCEKNGETKESSIAVIQNIKENNNCDKMINNKILIGGNKSDITSYNWKICKNSMQYSKKINNQMLKKTKKYKKQKSKENNDSNFKIINFMTLILLTVDVFLLNSFLNRYSGSFVCLFGFLKHVLSLNTNNMELLKQFNGNLVTMCGLFKKGCCRILKNYNKQMNGRKSMRKLKRKSKKIDMIYKKYN